MGKAGLGFLDLMLTGIAAQLHDAGITKTAVIIVGDALAAEGFADSYLYSAGRTRGSGH